MNKVINQDNKMNSTQSVEYIVDVVYETHNNLKEKLYHVHLMQCYLYIFKSILIRI